MQLEKVETLGSHPPHYAFDVPPGTTPIPDSGLRADEYLSIANFGHPRCNSLHGLSIGGGDIEMVDAMIENEVDGVIGLVLVKPPDGVCAE